MTARRPDRDLIDALWSARIDRRDFVARAGAAGLSVAAVVAALQAMPAGAQDATPVTTDGTPSATPGATPGATPVAKPVVNAEPFTSITRDEYLAQIRSTFTIEEPASTGGQIILGLTSDISTLNPILGTDVYSAYITAMVFNQLAVASPIDGSIVPDLADYWERAADGVTYTFHLNRNATWHDGVPVTSADVVFSFDAVLAEGSLSPRRSSVALVLESYRAVDDYTVEFISKGPVSIFIEKSVALIGIVPKHIWEGLPFDETWGTDGGATGADPARVIGSGPFVFTEREAGSYVTISKNPNYWVPDLVPTIDSFTIQVTPEASANIQALTTGQIDVAEVPFGQADTVAAANPQLVVANYPTTNFNYYTCRLDDTERSPFFTEIPVRQAMMWALDRDLIAESVYQGYASRADGTQPELSIAYAPDRIETIYTYSPEMANQLLDGAGWLAGDDGVRARDGVRLSFECLFSQGYAAYEQQIPAMQQYWADVGIEMNPIAIPFTTLLERVLSGDMQMTVLGFSWDVNGDQGDMFRSSAIPNAGFNTGHYSNTRYDELDAAQFAELDVDARIDILIEQSNIVNDDQAVGIMLFDQFINGIQTRVHNFLPNGYAFIWSLPYAWVDPVA